MSFNNIDNILQLCFQSIYSNTVVINNMFCTDYNLLNNSLLNKFYLSFQRKYRGVLKIDYMLYNKLKIGVCLGQLRSVFTQSIF